MKFHQFKQQMLNLLILVSCCILAAAAAADEVAQQQSSAAKGRQDASDQVQNHQEQPNIDRLLVMTIVQDVDNESFKRFNRSIETYKLDLNVVLPTSKPKQHKQGNSRQQQQLSLLKKALATYKSETNLLIMIVDSQNSILNGNQKDIVKRFSGRSNKRSRVIFSADSICWPNTSLANEYPVPPMGGDKYLNSGAYIGFAPALWDLLNQEEDKNGLLNSGGSQVYYTRAYLNATIRDKIGLGLDHKSELFQSLRTSQINDVRLEFNSKGVNLRNLAYGSEPIVALGNKESWIILNSLGNYLARAWTPEDGCRYCEQDKLQLAKMDENSLPIVLVGVFIEYATPFLEDFFEDLINIDYPQKRMHLLIHNSINYHDKVVQRFLIEHGNNYASQQVIAPQEPEWLARDSGLKRCKELNCDHYFTLDAVARIELPETLKILIETNKTIVAPLLNRPTKLWSNFWGAMTLDGYYARSYDYVELVKRDRVGLWDVPHIMNAYLINGRFIRDNLMSPSNVDSSSSSSLNQHNDDDDDKDQQQQNSKDSVRLTYRDNDLDKSLKPVLMFTSNLRDANIHLHMINTHEFGHLVDPTNYNISQKHPDFYQLAENVLDWERNYLHDNYSRILEEDDFKLEQPCQDVFWFPLVNEIFCQQLIEIMETFGEWSGGTNHDPRIEGGYESVPTRDIHMKQVGLHEMWLLFLRDYVMPIQLKEYIGYEHDPPRANLAFVVRYHPAEQASLQPHHDSSTYTLNIALNSPGIDYEGGGCRFERYNCSVTQSRRGWALMHPGRLTHYHEGLPVTNGTRYIMVTFVDP